MGYIFTDSQDLVRGLVQKSVFGSGLTCAELEKKTQSLSKNNSGHLDTG